jgi:nucleotide-binding universal stress UspA family protein
MDRSVQSRKPVAPIVRIFHPSDFSEASHVAFAHALKLALEAKADLSIMHVQRHVRRRETVRHWTDFPGVRSTLARWGILPEGARREEVGKTGLGVTKVLASSADPVKSIMRHLEHYPPDLIVLATHQREGLARWMHKPVAEKIARRSGAMTLFVPRDGKSFIAPEDGAVNLKKILIPVDRTPDPQSALDKAASLTRGLGCVEAEFALLHVGAEDEMPVLDPPYYPGWRWERTVRQGDVVDRILEVERDWDADLMVLVTEGHLDFLDALRGSTTERVLRGARCPVLAIPTERAW